MKVAIQPESTADFDQVYALNNLAFGQDKEAKLVDALRKSTAFIPGLSLVAVVEEKVVGHILFTKIRIIDNLGNAYESLALAPLSVLPEWQKKGIGAHLMEQGLLAAKELGYHSVIVLGHEHYYSKFGFVPASKWDIKAPFEVPDTAFMGIELIPGSLDNVTGTVEYPREFGIGITETAT